MATAQIDSEFWFVAPEVSTGVVGNPFDEPIFLRISTFGSSAQISISEPANSSFTTITKTIAANTTYSFDLTSYISQVENKPGDKVLSYGILIKSTAPITAYYDVASTYCKCNPEIFTLKGRNALGTDFLIPSQTNLNNSNNVFYSPTPYSRFDIVATQNGTTVQITPSNDITGHNKGSTFSVKLNKGETYSAVAASQLASYHLQGSHVVSDKPVAITISDDLLDVGGHADLSGDQLVPTSIVGKEYIVVKGPGNLESVYIMATEDNTAISIDGSYVTTISKGSTYTTTVSNNAMYIATSYPVYVLHMSGFGNEVSESLLPSINCTGSTQVNFVRSSTDPFDFVLLTQSGNEGSFTLNGNSSWIPASSFSVVPGTGGKWVAALVSSLTTTQVPVGGTSIVKNSKGVFHLGIFNGTSAEGAEYGFFSSFANLNLGPNQTMCKNDSIILDAGVGNTNYLWDDGSKGRFRTVKTAGTYYVQAEANGCTLNDTIRIKSDSIPLVNLGPDASICPKDSVVLNPGISNPNITIRWQDGSTKSTYTAKSAGKYWVQVSTSCGQTSDTVNVSVGKKTAVDIGPDQNLCQGDSIILHAAVSGDTAVTYLWQDGSTGKDIVVRRGGQYWIKVTGGCAMDYDTVLIAEYSTPKTFEMDTFVCGAHSLQLNTSASGSTYLWNDGSHGDSLIVNQSGTYWVSVSNACGSATDSFHVQVITFTDIKLPADTYLCPKDTLHLSVYRNGASYLWQDNSTQSYYNISGAGTYWVQVSQSGCSSGDTIVVRPSQVPEVSLGDSASLCEGDNIQIHLNPPFGSHIVWQDLSHVENYTISKPGIYTVVVSNACGLAIDTLYVKEQDCNCQFYVPTVFTPNRDTLNDVFQPLGCPGLKKYKLEIFNRWGERIFETEDRNKAWDGTCGGTKCQEGAYMYIIRYHDRYNASKIKYGTVTLVR